MSTRIVFNGKEYAGLEEMLDDVLKAFQAALAQVGTDADGNGVSDVLEGKGNVLGLAQSSITVNGRTVDNVKDLPLPVRWLLTCMVRQVAKRAPGAAPVANALLLRQLDSATSVRRPPSLRSGGRPPASRSDDGRLHRRPPRV